MTISNRPENATASGTADGEPELSTEDMFEITNTIIEEFQLGDISEVLGTEVTTLSIAEPPLPPSTPEWATLAGEEYNAEIVSKSQIDTAK